jgi:hypothetical protein
MSIPWIHLEINSFGEVRWLTDEPGETIGVEIVS